MGKNLQTGEVDAVEIGNQIPGQMSVADIPGVTPGATVEVEGKTVDTETGEIVAQEKKDGRRIKRSITVYYRSEGREHGAEVIGD